jgi:colicin import membrane protein
MRQARTYAALIFLVAAAPLFAQDNQFIGEEEKNELLGKAKTMRDEASAIREKANNEYAATEKACWKKFLVSSCQDDARRAQRQDVERARKIEHEARAIERDVKVRDVATREAKRVEEAPRRQAEAAARAEKNREAQEEALRRIERKKAEHAERENP